ncbi:hypothetical protein N184_35565 [Sinorhizobium sp. GL28]|nr:hypothetical protein N184_35565 [Sinorhizobium sp. GL28]
MGCCHVLDDSGEIALRVDVIDCQEPRGILPVLGQFASSSFPPVISSRTLTIDATSPSQTASIQSQKPGQMSKA